jgi:hypothetical protein
MGPRHFQDIAPLIFENALRASAKLLAPQWSHGDDTQEGTHAKPRQKSF